jgi:MoaA/NifB/PqqE/SkfB family radical SAM enzyme
MSDFIFTPVDTSYKPSFALKVGYSCNYKCIHCFIRHNQDKAEDIPLSVLKSLIDEVKEPIIIVTGGEPTIREELPELLKHIKSKNKTVNIQSNGFKFGDESYFNSIKSYIDTALIPIHSNDMSIFDAITQVPGSGEKTIKALYNFSETDILTMTQTVINQLNYKTLLETFDMIQNILPGSPMNLTFPHPIGVANSTLIVPRYSDIAKYIQPVLKKYAYLIRTHYVPKCYLYPYHSIVAQNVDDGDNGSVVKDGIDYFVEGNIGWTKTDYGEFKETEKIKSEKCKRCIFDKECIGVWREYGKLYPELDMNPIEPKSIKNIIN